MTRADGVIEQANAYDERVSGIDEQIVNQTSDLVQINETSLKAQEDLDSIMMQLSEVRSNLTALTDRLSSIELVSEDELNMLNETVSRLNETVQQNDRLIKAAQEKMLQLEQSTDQLVDKNKQLKQHRDLLGKIRDNIGDYTCTLSN